MSNVSLGQREEIGIILARCRMNSYDESLRTQEALAKALNKPKKKISDIENGYGPISLELAANWCLVTRQYESWKLIESMYGLEILSTPPIHPDYTECMVGAISNLRKQIDDAAKAMKRIEEIWNERKPGRVIEWRSLVPHAQQIFDVSQAVETLLFALERECGMNLYEVTRTWTQEQHSKEIVMTV